MTEKSTILEVLHSQFAENQNHHQGLFIKFLIALFMLFGGFGFVYIHTKSCIPYDQTYVLSDNYGIYFSNFILLGTSVFVISVLLLLNLIILNLGYGFRRDQHLNMRIRKRELQHEYDDIFEKLYNSDNKSFWNYLPNFYMIFFLFTTGFQFFILIAISNKEELTCFYGHPLALRLFIACILLIVVSLVFYAKTYCKYEKNLRTQ
jgi:Trk-type K+ transport system membrane component